MRLTLNIDVSEQRLHLTAFLKVKPDSEAAKSIADVATGEAGALGNLAAGSMAYMYMNVASKTFQQLQSMSLQMLSGGGKPSPELEKAMAEMHGLGRIESIGSSSMDNGMRTINDIKVADPQKFMDASIAMLKAMGSGDGPGKIYKDLKIEPAAQTDRGMTFTHVAGDDRHGEAGRAGGERARASRVHEGHVRRRQDELLVSARMARGCSRLSPRAGRRPGRMIDTYLKGTGGVGADRRLQGHALGAPQEGQRAHALRDPGPDPDVRQPVLDDARRSRT